MEIINTVPTFDATTHRMASTYTDTPDPERNRIVRVWAVEPIPLTEVKVARKAAATAKRHEVETGGIIVAGASIRTDRESQSLINGAYSLARDMLAGDVQTMPIDFKGADGWAEIEPATMLAIGRAVALHVQACFRAERALHEAIDAAETAEAVMAVDIASGWPD
ncbi:hypothetical protein A6A40_17355 (plasmid) [Azospirillum humicireducens]|uniref:DUF4376 domain-containing protein n=1 Tax=Azospirillum humicireducens TaxID=1226968 RepID=A0A2R4VQU9_9PROT|nr:DUF4376 domain-containing protein [Azospirillum humicireducens]AWB06819.1 hypothetical protein A6A40_17355 [Azospirillum humicireducens]